MDGGCVREIALSQNGGCKFRWLCRHLIPEAEQQECLMVSCGMRGNIIVSLPDAASSVHVACEGSKHLLAYSYLKQTEVSYESFYQVKELGPEMCRGLSY